MALLIVVPRTAQAVIGIDVDPNLGIVNAVVVNDSIGAGALYNSTTYSPTFDNITFLVPFGGDFGQGATLAVVDLGLIDNTNEAVMQVNTFYNINLPTNPVASPPANLLGAHATEVATFAAGFNPAATDNVVSLTEFGIAPLATLWSGSIVDSGDPNADNNVQTAASVLYPFVQTMHVGVNSMTADVVNASFGAPSVPVSDDFLSEALDGLAAQNPHSTLVISAGNDGPGANTIDSPGAAFNNISVGALAADPTLAYQQIAGFSSRGPSDFFNPNTQQTIPNVRPGVDISAPGDEFIIAATPIAGEPGFYSIEYGSGTSFAAPLVSGAVAQLDAYAHGLTSLAGSIGALDPQANQRIDNATDSRVIKAILLNSADKTHGWNNGQTMIGGVLTTALGLDTNVGAGALNVARAADNFLNGNFNPQVVGTALVGPKGWDLSTVSDGQPNIYDLGQLTAGQTLTATLDWFADNTYDADNVAVSVNRFANLNLEVLKMISPGDFQEIAISDNPYNNVQQLSFLLNDTADYELEVLYAGVQFAPAGDTTNSEQYGLAWSNVNVPEPALLGLIVPVMLAMRRRRLT